MTDKKISELPEVFSLPEADTPIYPVVANSTTSKFRLKRLVSANFGKTTSGNIVTATAAEIAGGSYIGRQYNATGAIEVTLPSATDIAERCRQKGVIYDTTQPDQGATYILHIMNNSDSLLTLVAGADTDIFGTATIPAAKYRDYFVEVYWDIDAAGVISNVAAEISNWAIGDF